MNDLQRFLAVVKGEKPDYIPIFGFSEAPGMAGGVMKKTYDRLVATGMPEDVGGIYDLCGVVKNLEGWYKYWGCTAPVDIDFFPGELPRPMKFEKLVEDGWEIIEYETGAITRQVVDNDITYIMPEYRKYHVRDRSSWEYYKKIMTPGKPWTGEQIDEACRKFDRRDKPVRVNLYPTWGGLRNLVGPEMACTILYDDPDLAREILEWFQWTNRTYLFPVIERLKPEIITISEDICYNHGMFISPAHFREFCMPAYREIGEVAAKNGVAMAAVDSDGLVEQLVPLLEECGFNTLFPWEVKAGNDLFKIRREHPGFVIMGGLEKEAVNEGNEHIIEAEIMSKVPWLLEKGRYFPNGDHGIQPLVTFRSLCRFMTLLHEVCKNPEGEFPRVRDI